MDILEVVRKKIYPAVLKEKGYKKKGKTWYKELNSGVVLMIASDVRSVKKNEFFYSISYGVYYEGVSELMYGFPFKIETGIIDSLVISSMNTSDKPNSWSFEPYSNNEAFLNFVQTFLLNKALPFLDKFIVPSDIATYIEPLVGVYLKKDSIVVLKLATLYYLIGEKQHATELVQKVISSSKVKYTFAEDLLKKFI